MIPPTKLDVLDEHKGFTAITGVAGKLAPSVYIFRSLDSFAKHDVITRHRFQTIWRPGSVLKKQTTRGQLAASSCGSFYQTNNDVTLAFYQLEARYPYLVACWFNNSTGERIA
jgi:hypothetical protein